MKIKKAGISIVLLVLLCFFGTPKTIEYKNRNITIVNDPITLKSSAILIKNMSLRDADASFIGEANSDDAGTSVAGVGDVNGDGYDDILIGASESGSSQGKAYLIFGRNSDWSNNISLSNANASFVGEAAGDLAGYSVAGAGDVNNDSYDDLLIGAIGNGGSWQGKVYLILGRENGWSTDISLLDANASFIGEASNYEAGSSVAGAGDINGDGYDDILIGASGGGSSSQGKAYIILGKASGWVADVDLSEANASFVGEATDDLAGCSVAGAGDVNNDTYNDILVGAKDNGDGGSFSGKAYLILGNASGWSINKSLSEANASFIGEGGYDYAGGSVAGAGDVDNDGYDDILIGAYRNDMGSGNDGGQSYIIFGKASGWSIDVDLSEANASFVGETDGDYSGRSVAGAGDVNGDGCDDILIGARYHDDGAVSNVGKAYLILGKVSGWAKVVDLSEANASFIGESVDDYFGYSVAGAGDIDNDGYDDILIGSEAGGGNDEGKTYLLFPSYPLTDPPGDFTLYTNANGTSENFDLFWTTSSNAANYTVYMADTSITVINAALMTLGTLITVVEGLIGTTYPVANLTDGTYYFVVGAFNEYGNNTSNVIGINIDSELLVPGYDTLVIIGVIGVVSVIVIKRKKNKAKFVNI